MRLKRLESALVRAESALLVALLSFMVLLAFSQVAARQFFHAGLLWGDTLLRHLVLWVGFLGACLATADDKHFAWDTLTALLKGRARAAVALAAHAAAMLICALLVKASWAYFLDEKTSGKPLFSVGEHPVPEWIFVAIVPIGFSLITLHTAIKAAREAAALAGPRQPQ